jgi:hypothetical protein
MSFGKSDNGVPVVVEPGPLTEGTRAFVAGRSRRFAYRDWSRKAKGIHAFKANR